MTIEKKTFDLKNMRVATAAQRPTRVELEDPSTGEVMTDENGEPYYVDALGEDSPEVRAIDRKHADNRADKLRKVGGKNPLASENLEREAAERLAVATIGWRLPPNDGEEIPFTPANARAVYANDDLVWIAEQVAKAMRDRSRFLQKA